MYYRQICAPALIKSGENLIGDIDGLLRSAHLFFERKILVTQKNLLDIYGSLFEKNAFEDTIIVKGGDTDEVDDLCGNIKDRDALIVAFGGGSVIDLVKYSASRSDVPYITVPSALSNDAVYSCVARLMHKGKKTSFGVQPPIGIVVDFDVIRNAPSELLLAGVADIVSNLSALKDWKLAHKQVGEPINELAYMLSKESVMPLLRYRGSNVIFSDDFLYDLTNSIVTSGLAMIIAGNTRVSSGAEHLISHAIDEYFPEKSTIHGLQVGWAHLLVEKRLRADGNDWGKLMDFYASIGLIEAIQCKVPWSENEFNQLIPYAKKIRNRYTVLNTI